MKTALFDYGAGNLHSLGKSLERAGAEVIITNDWQQAISFDALVMPGVGAFGHAAAALPADRDSLRDALAAGLPALGICLGMQLLFDTSDESVGHGIGFIPGQVQKLQTETVPQMGWNDIETGKDPIFDGTRDLVAYYANSYVCVPKVDADAIAWSEYGGTRYVAAARKANAWGLQFHPEKSSDQGRRILENWVTLAKAAANGGVS
jgi:glutamine amidotransferase